jgi:hypothetical protein
LYYLSWSRWQTGVNGAKDITISKLTFEERVAAIKAGKHHDTI